MTPPDSRVPLSRRLPCAALPSLLLAIAGATLPLEAIAYTEYRSELAWVGQENDLPDWGGCGAAVAKMIVESPEVGGPVLTLDQYRAEIERLRVEGPGQTPLHVSTDPTAMGFVIAENDPRSHPWTNTYETDAKTAAAHLRNALLVDQTPAAAAVYAGGHWVTVSGVRVSTVNAREILEGFYLLDPEKKPQVGARKELKHQWVPYVTWTRSFQTPSRYGKPGLTLGKLVSVVDPETPVGPADFDEPTRPAPGVLIADASEAMSVADSIVLSQGFSSVFAGWSAQVAEAVSISHTTDTGWWVGFGPSAGQIQGGILVDSDQRDLLVAGWNFDDPMSWDERADYWPYLGDRIPTNAPDLDTSGLFQIQALPEPGPGALLGIGGILLAVRLPWRRRAEATPRAAPGA